MELLCSPGCNTSRLVPVAAVVLLDLDLVTKCSRYMLNVAACIAQGSWFTRKAL